MGLATLCRQGLSVPLGTITKTVTVVPLKLCCWCKVSPRAGIHPLFHPSDPKYAQENIALKYLIRIEGRKGQVRGVQGYEHFTNIA